MGNASTILMTDRLMDAGSQAPAAVRSDQIVVSHPAGSTRLRYVSCPFAPFLESSQQNVCSAP